jgi:hypothetical protein
VAQSIFITSAEGHSGKSTVALGVLDALSHATARVGVFRAIARSTAEPDYVLEMLLDHDGVDLPYDECIGVTYDDVRHDPDAALAVIVERYKAVEAQCEAVVILGSDYTDVGSPAELAYNARIAANLGAPVLLVLGGRSSEGATQPEQRSPSSPTAAPSCSRWWPIARIRGSSPRPWTRSAGSWPPLRDPEAPSFRCGRSRRTATSSRRRCAASCVPSTAHCSRAIPTG